MTERDILIRIWWSVWIFGLANLVAVLCVGAAVAR